LSILSSFPLLAFPQTNAPIDTWFNVVLTKNTEPKGVLAACATAATDPCEGYRLQTRLTRSGDTLIVFINGLIRPAPCIQSSNNATGDVFLGDISPGTHHLRITYRGQSDMYEIIAGDKWFGVIALRSDFTELRSDL
jgi:hypothetical protein